MITCFVCHRKLSRCAVPGLQIGPKCARDRGYIAAPEPRSIVTHIPRGKRTDAQLDWVNQLNAGLLAGESRP